MILFHVIALVLGQVLRFALVTGASSLALYEVYTGKLFLDALPRSKCYDIRSSWRRRHYFTPPKCNIGQPTQRLLPLQCSQNTQVLVYYSPATTQTITSETREYGSTSYFTTTLRHFSSEITPPITTTVHGSASTISYTQVPEVVTRPDVEATATSSKVITSTIGPQPFMVPHETPTTYENGEPDTCELYYFLIHYSLSQNG
ncbi:hypothetical protein DL96DRAFT_1579507 [Flagelloscypha sp. PMI_526]|nr:hypothetical protein DL96DRAFT_1579507 [Flagelloscypha sp. PMI_526]